MTDCKEWRREMTDRVRQGDWTTLRPSACAAGCGRCDYAQSYWYHPLRGLLMASMNPFEDQLAPLTEERLEAIERLHGGPPTATDWLNILWVSRPTKEYLADLYARGCIYPNASTGHYDPLLMRYVSGVLSDVYDEERMDLVRWLVEKGESVNLQAESGATALHETVVTMRCLMEDGAVDDPSLETVYGMMMYLLEHGADPLLEDREGKSAYDLLDRGMDRWRAAMERYL